MAHSYATTGRAVAPIMVEYRTEAELAEVGLRGQRGPAGRST
ncbi:hypothetical protein ACFWEJ_00485 [Promicromonospora sp. NPDC060204]